MDAAKERAWEIRRAAQQDGGLCGLCGRALALGEPVWRPRIGLGYSGSGAWHWQIIPVCAECTPIEGEPSRPCEGCGRPVHDEWRLPPRKYVLCCEACSPKAQAARARATRAKSREGKTCPLCEKSFVPSRIDALFCSVACKQRAYRARQK